MTVSLVPVSNVGAGLPAGARSFDLKVTTDAGTKWASGDLQFSLASSGAFAGTSFFNLASGDSNIVNTAAAGAAGLDTGITVPAGGNGAAILGKAQYPVESGIGSAVFPSTAAPGTAVDIAWGDTGAASFTNGTSTIARLSILGNGGADLKGRVGATNNSIAPVTFNLYLPIKGDVNGDRIVDLGDFNTWLANGGQGTLGGAPLLSQGDINQDGIIDLGDFNDWLANGGNQLPVSGASLGSVVPEPASLSLAAIAGLSLAARRRRA
jgi:hypothetical protein